MLAWILRIQKSVLQVSLMVENNPSKRTERPSHMAVRIPAFIVQAQDVRLRPISFRGTFELSQNLDRISESRR
jgi:hypothetical protein